MELTEKIKSNEDKTVKYVFKLENGLIMETTYIDNNTGKDIICVATQTMCGMGCTFCHLTDFIGKIDIVNLSALDIVKSVDYIYQDLNLANNERMLLVSYMGCGEPLLNLNNVVKSMKSFMLIYPRVRFGLATSLPKWKAFMLLATEVKNHNIPLKVHLSLHYTNDEQRKQFMPNALPIKASIAALEFYKEITGNSVEVHYTMIKGVNDTLKDSAWLGVYLENREIPVKFLRFSTKETSQNEGAEKESISSFMDELEHLGIHSEYYEPPGKDVGASCGQFLMDKYELKKEIKNEETY